MEKQPITPSTSGSHYSVSCLTEEENKPWISIRKRAAFSKENPDVAEDTLSDVFTDFSWKEQY